MDILVCFYCSHRVTLQKILHKILNELDTTISNDLYYHSKNMSNYTECIGKVTLLFMRIELQLKKSFF